MKIARCSIVISLFLVVVSLSFSSAVTCSQSSLSQSANTGDTPTSQAISCTNPLSTNVQVNKIGSFFSTIPSGTFLILANQTQSIQVNYNSGLSSNYYEGALTFSDSTVIPITVNVSAPQSNPNSCQINPSLASYTQSIQQGTQIPLPKITFNPINCGQSVLILSSSTVSIQGGILTPQGQKPVFISSIVNDGVFINIDTAGLNTQQTYSSLLNVQAYGKTFQIPFIIIVTSGTSPATNFSCSNLPSCSLSATVLNLNQTYSLICNNIQPDVTIQPSVDNGMVQGVGVDTSATQFIWYFQPKNFGNTFIKGNFLYRNSPVCSSFSQEVKISSSGVVSPGTSLSLLFTPSLNIAKKGESVKIQVVDNKSGSLVPNSEIFIDAIFINQSLGVFNYNFDTEKNYSIRARANGYDDYISSVALTRLPLDIFITPISGDDSTNYQINTSAENASLFLDGNKINNPYIGKIISGNHELRAIKEGYFEIAKNITVEISITVIPPQELKLSSENILQLSKNATWILNYQENDLGITNQLLNGSGSYVSFKPEKSGIYSLIANDKPVWKQELKNDTWKFLGVAWYWYAITLTILGITWIYYKNGGSGSEGMPYAPSINT